MTYQCHSIRCHNVTFSFSHVLVGVNVRVKIAEVARDGSYKQNSHPPEHSAHALTVGLNKIRSIINATECSYQLYLNLPHRGKICKMYE